MEDSFCQEITLAEAAKHLPKRKGNHVSIATLHRWIVKGYRGVKLRGMRLGGIGWVTTLDALEEFKRACTERAGGEPRRTERENNAAVEAAQKRLEEDGFYGKPRVRKKGRP